MFRTWRKQQWLLVLLAIVVMSCAVLPAAGVSAAEGTDASEGATTVTIVDKGSTWSYSDEGIDYSDAIGLVCPHCGEAFSYLWGERDSASTTLFQYCRQSPLESAKAPKAENSAVRRR